MDGKKAVEAKAAAQVGRRLSGVVVLGFVLVATLWGVQYFRAEARVRRATQRVVELAQKPGAESPVALGLAGNRLGEWLAADAVMELDGAGEIAQGRGEIVQLFVRIRGSLARMEFRQPRIAVAEAGGGLFVARVDARYWMEADGSDVVEGDGTAVMQWGKGRDGWKIGRVRIESGEEAKLPGGWL